jgi:hypothetical protein
MAGAIAGLGWTEEQFWDSSPALLASCHVIAGKREQALSRERWEMTRWLAAACIAPHAKGGKIEPQKLLKFDWDREHVEPTKPSQHKRVVERLGSKIRKP